MAEGKKYVGSVGNAATDAPPLPSLDELLGRPLDRVSLEALEERYPLLAEALREMEDAMQSWLQACQAMGRPLPESATKARQAA